MTVAGQITDERLAELATKSMSQATITRGEVAAIITELQHRRANEEMDLWPDDPAPIADKAVDHVFKDLAKALGLETWNPQDGSETWEGDVYATMMRILTDAGVIDEMTGKLAAQVKALEWKPVALVEGYNWLTVAQAETPFWRYTIDKHDKGFFRVMFGNRRVAHRDDKDAAYAAAQADYEARIRSALGEHP